MVSVNFVSRYLSGFKYFAYGYISVLFIRIHPSGLCTPTTHSFVFALLYCFALASYQFDYNIFFALISYSAGNSAPLVLFV